MDLGSLMQHKETLTMELFRTFASTDALLDGGKFLSYVVSNGCCKLA